MRPRRWRGRATPRPTPAMRASRPAWPRRCRAARPRQPACAAATTHSSRAANSTGMQSATRIASGASARRVTSASARAGLARSAAMLPASTIATSRPWTCSSHTGGAGRNAASRRRFSAIGRIIAVVRAADVERGARAAADTAVARGHERVHARRRRPRRHDPVEALRGERPGEVRQRHRARAALRAMRRNRPAARTASASACRSADAGATSRHAWSAWRCIGGRPGMRRGVPYTASPTSGWRTADRCTRIWCVRPVSRRALDERGDRVALARLDVRARDAPAGDHGHRRARRRMARDRRVDRHRALDVAVGDRQVLALDAARRQRALQRRLRLDRACDDEQPAGVLVEAVHDARARHRGERRRVMQQRVEEGAGAVARARMHDEAGRLVDDDQRGVLVDDRRARSTRRRARRRRRPAAPRSPASRRRRGGGAARAARHRRSLRRRRSTP